MSSHESALQASRRFNCNAGCPYCGATTFRGGSSEQRVKDRARAWYRMHREGPNCVVVLGNGPNMEVWESQMTLEMMTNEES